MIISYQLQGFDKPQDIIKHKKTHLDLSGVITTPKKGIDLRVKTLETTNTLASKFDSCKKRWH